MMPPWPRAQPGREDEITGPENVLSNNITGDSSSRPAVDTGAANQRIRFYRAV
jgi:hypothetical protein